MKNLNCATFDLGAIALHRFQINTRQLKQSCVLYYSELSSFFDSWASKNREKVHMADCVLPSVPFATPLGTRGCRYVHVVYFGTLPPEIEVWAWAVVVFSELNFGLRSGEENTILNGKSMCSLKTEPRTLFEHLQGISLHVWMEE